MKMDIKTNYTIAVGLAPVSVAVGTDAGATIDHALAPCAAVVFNLGAFASGAAITCKLQYSDDDSTWSDDDASSGNDAAVKSTATGITTLNVPNPLGRYTRGYITVATDAVVVGVVNMSGPLKRVTP